MEWITRFYYNFIAIDDNKIPKIIRRLLIINKLKMWNLIWKRFFNWKLKTLCIRQRKKKEIKNFDKKNAPLKMRKFRFQKNSLIIKSIAARRTKIRLLTPIITIIPI